MGEGVMASLYLSTSGVNIFLKICFVIGKLTLRHLSRYDEKNIFHLVFILLYLKNNPKFLFAVWVSLRKQCVSEKKRKKSTRTKQNDRMSWNGDSCDLTRNECSAFFFVLERSNAGESTSYACASQRKV